MAISCVLSFYIRTILLPKKERQPRDDKNSQNIEYLFETEVGEVKIVIQEEQAEVVSRKGCAHTEEKIDV